MSGGTVLSDFEAGKQVTIRLSLKESDARWANKKAWVYGIKSPMKKIGSYFIPDCLHLQLWFGREGTDGMIATS